MSNPRVTEILHALRHGRAIDNGGRLWSVADLLTLAGCVQCAVLDHAARNKLPGAFDPSWCGDVEFEASLDDGRKVRVKSGMQDHADRTMRVTFQWCRP